MNRCLGLGLAMVVSALAGCTQSTTQTSPSSRDDGVAATPAHAAGDSTAQPGPSKPAQTPDNKEPKVIKPGHSDVVAAVKRAGDKELESLVQDQDSYTLRHTEMPDVENHQVFRVMFVDTDHPMSFWLATDALGGDVTVLSQNLPGLHAFLRDEAALWSSVDLPTRFHDLYRHQGVPSKLLDSPKPVVERSPGGIKLELAVDSDGEREVWRVVLPVQGEPSITVEDQP